MRRPHLPARNPHAGDGGGQHHPRFVLRRRSVRRSRTGLCPGDAPARGGRRHPRPRRRIDPSGSDTGRRRRGMGSARAGTPATPTRRRPQYLDRHLESCGRRACPRPRSSLDQRRVRPRRRATGLGRSPSRRAGRDAPTPDARRTRRRRRPLRRRRRRCRRPARAAHRSGEGRRSGRRPIGGRPGHRIRQVGRRQSRPARADRRARHPRPTDPRRAVAQTFPRAR